MKKLLAAAAVAALMGACSQSAPPVPRPRGFARVEAYADSLATCTIAGVSIGVSAEAVRTAPRADWLDAAFGRHRATLHLSVAHPADARALTEAMENRTERIALNLPGAAEVSDFNTPGGFAVRLVESLEPSPVPLQFMATDSSGTFISGAVAITGPVVPADSAAAAVADLRRQLLLTLNSLSRCR